MCRMSISLTVTNVELIINSWKMLDLRVFFYELVNTQPDRHAYKYI